jgi:hypothetical protein
VYGIVLLTVLLSVGLSYAYFHFSYFEECEASYLFQAKLFAQGRIAAPPPPEMGLSIINNNVAAGKWYSRYFFGNALLLSLGVLIGAPWMIPALASGAAVFVLYKILLEVYGPRTALLGAILAVLSPATLVLGALPYSEAASRLFLGIFLLSTILAIRRSSGVYAALSGLALGYSLNIRPLTAVVFGSVGAAMWLYRFREEKAAPLIRHAALAVALFLPGVGLMLAWNAALTGSPWQSTFNAAQPYDRMGFGAHAEGYDLDPRRIDVYTPVKGVERALTKTIPAVSFTSLGWGYYHPLVNRWLLSGSASSRARLLLRMTPTLLPLLLMCLPLLRGSRGRYDAFFFCLPLLNLAAYFFLYGDGSTWGNSPTETRYYSECMMFGMLPLVARGLLIAWEWLRLRWRGRAPFVAAALGSLLLLNTLYTYAHFDWSYRGAFYWGLERQVREQAIHHAVIFVPGTRAPLGGYPFQNLQEADVVYFRLGPSKMWGLPPRDPADVYARYFQGRRAFLLQDGNLVALEMGRVPETMQPVALNR